MINQQRKFPGDRWKEGEASIINGLSHQLHPSKLGFAIKYASGAIKGRWKELEDLIIEGLKSPDEGFVTLWALTYVSEVKERWPELEKHIEEAYVEPNRPCSRSLIMDVLKYWSSLNITKKEWPAGYKIIRMV